MAGQWILLAYTLPAEPSRKRVLAWRHLRKLGAVYLETGLWVLPQNPSMLSALEPILAEIKHMGGKLSAFSGSDIGESQNDELRDAFNQVRREEYADLLGKCRRFLAHAERLAKAGDFRFAEVEELEEDLEKRRRWLAQVIARDAFGIEARQEVEACLMQCEEALARFVEQSFLAN